MWPPRQIFLCQEKLQLGNHSLSDGAEQQVHSLCYLEISPFTGAALLLGLRGFRGEESGFILLEATRSSTSVAYSWCSLSLYQHTRPALTCLRSYEQGMENKTLAGGWRQQLQRSCCADSHAQSPFPTHPSCRALFPSFSQHKQDAAVLNDSSLFPCL